MAIEVFYRGNPGVEDTGGTIELRRDGVLVEVEVAHSSGMFALCKMLADERRAARDLGILDARAAVVQALKRDLG